jgi:tight adherence protein B
MLLMSQNLVIFGFVLLLLVGLGLVAMIFNIGFSSGMRERLELYGGVPETRQKNDGYRTRMQLNRVRMRLNNMLSVFATTELNMALMSANWPITETEFILIRIWVTIAGFASGWILTGSIFPGIGLAVIGFVLPKFILQRSIHNRRIAFGNQLNDVLLLLSGAVRGGYSLPQAMDFVSKEVPAPAADEFKRVQFETSLGLPLTQALHNMTVRMQNDDLALLVAAININLQVGGNLVTMMRSVSTTIKDRIRLYGEVRVLTSQQRFSSYVLTLMPFGIFAMLMILNPTFAGRLLAPGPTLCFPIGALVLTFLGNIVISRITRITV